MRNIASIGGYTQFPCRTAAITQLTSILAKRIGIKITNGIHTMKVIGRKASSLSPLPSSVLLRRKIPSKFCSPASNVSVLTIDRNSVEKGDLYIGGKKLVYVNKDCVNLIIKLVWILNKLPLGKSDITGEISLLLTNQLNFNYDFFTVCSEIVKLPAVIYSNN